MLHRLTLLAVTTVATVALMSATATAADITPSETHAEAISRPLTFAGSSININCTVTFDITLVANVDTTLPVARGTLVGEVTAVDLTNCSQPTTILRETLPWPIRLGDNHEVADALDLEIGEVYFLVGPILGVACLAQGPAFGITNSGGTPAFRVDERRTISTRGGLSLFGCTASTGTFSGTSEVSPEVIILTLVP